MECAVFALVGVLVGALVMLSSKVDLGSIRKRSRKQEAVQTQEAALPGTAKSEEQLMRQWENLLCYCGDGDNEAHL